MNIIARLYVGIKLSVDQFGCYEPDVIPSNLLVCMNDSCTADWCLTAFDTIVREKKLENDVAALKRTSSNLEQKNNQLENEVACLKAKKYKPENSSESDDEKISRSELISFLNSRSSAKRKALPTVNVENESSKTIRPKPGLG